jgi:hypothetical protein
VSATSSILLTCSLSINSGVLFTWFESFPVVFGSIYHFNMGQQGLVFLGLFVGTLFAVPISLLWNRHHVVPLFASGTFKPEEMLPITFLGAAALPVCLLWYGWSAKDSVHFMIPIVGSSLFAVSLVTLFPPVLNYLGIAYPKYVASIFAGNGLFRATFGAIFPLFVRDPSFYRSSCTALTVSSGSKLVRPAWHRAWKLCSRWHCYMLHAATLDLLEGNDLQMQETRKSADL